MLRMIIVEDEHLIRNWLSQVIDYKQMGIDLLACVRDGQEGIEVIEGYRPDIVLTDIMMPRKTAFDMFEATRTIPYQKIILSSFSDFQNAKKAIRYGVYNFLEKPLDKEELRDCLWQICLDLKTEAAPLASEEGLSKQFPTIDLPVIDGNYLSAQVISYLHHHYNQTLSTERIAHHFGYSESYLYKKVKEELGITIKDYLNRYRIRRAIKLILEEPHLLVYQVSEAVGYSDYNYFGKVFRRYTGLTFTEFKENFTH
ncbi:helix-turn-helix domain-containing protein [Streptococcus pseudoporcinus]|uniref:Transcriptional regulator, AraC family n=1 Tax=Streptococcus pseudoporcinus TaxID=361101 RepID=A0A4U9XHR5_9STRE|nr:helix-turn-helix domain-containing protein [Streptococcus pseudoporcinus]VTS12703.1 transcriptional regulator, AraC family [Streptococcus pseudoporcinus]VUC65407.1 transcriptional regulator, AraC family [Streptococcus pseudoporcinus]VUC96296.1 transcriptional regulator, AraC family [Streptococcus pseudoporcinus]VUC96690.1 transcriptional regulator, AraC family [Streptococcus pseudoporcinus]